MNVFENEIAKYERRIASIERKPSALMMASNALFYRAQLMENKELLKSWHEGKSFLGVTAPNATLMRCFGDFRILPLLRIADRLGAGRAEETIQKVRALGLPEYACDRTILFLPLAFMGDDLPKPKLIVASTGACEVTHDSHRTLANMLGVPLYTIDVPFEDPHEQHLGYVTAQLERLIEWVEGTLPGAKFDERKLVKLQEFARRWHDALHDIYELRKRVPCPDHPRDVFREPMFPGQFTDPSMLVQYYEQYRDELRERAEKGFTPVGEEKLRIVWGVTGPYGSNIWDYLVERGVSVPYWHFGGAQRDFGITPKNHGDETEFGRRLSPLEEEARMMLYNSWGGSGERWVRDTVFACREFKADGFVYFDQTGCQPVLGMGQMVKKRLQEELGIPMWYVEGRQLLGRTERTNAEFMAGLEAFVNLCFRQKEATPVRNAI